MRKLPPITTWCLLINLLASGLMFFGWSLTAALAGILTFCATFVEVKRYTGAFQFIMIYFSCLLIGLSLDKHMLTFPFFSTCLFFCATACLVRFMLFPVFTFTRLLWMEPLLIFLSLVFYISGIFRSGFNPWAFVFPAPIIASAIILSATFIKDKNKLLAQKIKGLAVGKKASEFELPDQDGNLVKLSDFKNARHVLLIFVRGDWCPCCHMMLRTYEKNNEVFRSKNVFVMAIGPDPVGVNRAMVEKLGLDFKVLSDTGQRTAMTYGVQFKDFENTFADDYQEGIPLPASFLIDKEGIVRYVSRPDKVGEFLNPSLIFPIVEQLA